MSKSMDELANGLRAEGFEVAHDIGPAAVRVLSDPVDVSGGPVVWQFCVMLEERSGGWTICEPNAAWIRFRSPTRALEFVVRLRALRREERSRDPTAPQASHPLTEADIQRRAFPCLRCKRPFRFRAMPSGARRILKDLNLRLPDDGRKPRTIRAIRELRDTMGCPVADAKGIWDHVSILWGRHPLERELRCHQCGSPLSAEPDFEDCAHCGALNLHL